MPEILLLEDDLRLAESLIGAVELRGHTVSHATTVTEAVELVSAKPGAFQLVISDLELPDGDGVSFLAWLREHDETVPRVLQSGSFRTADVERLSNEGAAEHVLVKDISGAARPGRSPLETRAVRSSA
jgi:DNA-binding response OmpR family regulator